MKTKKILSLLLTVIIAVGIFGCSAFAEDTVKAYVTISKYGSIVTDKNGAALADAEVELSGKETYTIDDVLAAAHEAYFDGGADAGYASEEGLYGLSLTKLWGNTSGNFAYQLNSGTVEVMGLTAEVNDGDSVDAYICESFYPDTESYTAFDKRSAEIFTNEELTLNLQWAGYDDNWQMVFYPCEGAEITVDGNKTEILTDENGDATLSFEDAGVYIVSAEKTKTLQSEQTVTAITAPLCVVTVTEKETDTVMIKLPNRTELVLEDMSGEEIAPADVREDADGTAYFFELEDGARYSYTVTGSLYKKYTGAFTARPDYELEITSKMLTKKESRRSSGRSSGGASLTAKQKEETTENNTVNNTEANTEKKFTDVNADAWYAGAVRYVAEKGLFEGVSDTEFAPSANMTRAMFVTVLYRLNGEETTDTEKIFEDVDTASWYGKAVLWATGKGIIKGMSETEFAPDRNISFEQMILILYRYAQLKGIDTEKKAEAIPHEDSASEWALDALGWAYAQEIIGEEVAKQLPSEPSPRASIADALMRFCENVIK